MFNADEANQKYFREAYRIGEHGWAVHEPSPYAVRYLERLKGAIPGGTLLDVGCGEGRHAFAASRLGFSVTAIDYEPLALFDQDFGIVDIREEHGGDGGRAIALKDCTDKSRGG